SFCTCLAKGEPGCSAPTPTISAVRAPAGPPGTNNDSGSKGDTGIFSFDPSLAGAPASAVTGAAPIPATKPNNLGATSSTKAAATADTSSASKKSATDTATKTAAKDSAADTAPKDDSAAAQDEATSDIALCSGASSTASQC